MDGSAQLCHTDISWEQLGIETVPTVEAHCSLVWSGELRDDLRGQYILLVTETKSAVAVVTPNVYNTVVSSAGGCFGGIDVDVPGIINSDAVLLSRGNLHNVLALEALNEH